MARIAARYIGKSAVKMDSRPGDPYLDANQAPLKPRELYGQPTLYLEYGDSVMMDESEVLGTTYLVNVHTDQSIIYGVGFAPIPEHKDKSWKELIGERFEYERPKQGEVPAIPLGTYFYQFHIGRQDFEPWTKDTRSYFYNIPQEPCRESVAPSNGFTATVSLSAESEPEVQ